MFPPKIIVMLENKYNRNSVYEGIRELLKQIGISVQGSRNRELWRGGPNYCEVTFFSDYFLILSSIWQEKRDREPLLKGKKTRVFSSLILKRDKCWHWEVSQQPRHEEYMPWRKGPRKMGLILKVLHLGITEFWAYSELRSKKPRRAFSSHKLKFKANQGEVDQ